MSLNPLTLLEKAINEHGSSTILKERLALVKDVLAKVEQEKSNLERELAIAREEISCLKSLVPSTDFVQYRGVKFKRKPSGGYEKTAYCPSCEVGMASTSSGSMPLVCGKCNALSGFKSRELVNVLKEVESEYS
ncbi:hypothetical protein ES703_54058 [subsurface metagenome]